MKHIKPLAKPITAEECGCSFRIPWCWLPVRLGVLIGVDKYCDPIVP